MQPVNRSVLENLRLRDHYKAMVCHVVVGDELIHKLDFEIIHVIFDQDF
jgi:hypothetical protein